MRERGVATVPTTIALERATNPFMRAASVEELAEAARCEGCGLDQENAGATCSMRSRPVGLTEPIASRKPLLRIAEPRKVQRIA